MLKLLPALIGLFAAGAGVLLFLGISVGVWWVRAEVFRQTAYLATRAEAAGRAADNTIAFVRQALDRAEADLAAARAEIPPPSHPPVNPLVQLAARQASLQLAGSVQRAQGAVEAASDAVTIADAVLDVVDEFPELKQLFGVEQAHLDRTRYALGQIAEDIRRARTMLGIPIDRSIFTLEELNMIDAALRQTRYYTDEMDRVVRTARERVASLRSRVEWWADRLSVAVSAVAVWAAVGQVFWARFCLRRLSGQPA